MEIKHKLISADSHAGFDRDDFTDRMSASKWGENIPHIVETKEAANGSIAGRYMASRATTMSPIARH